jgi:Excalibur calcium-binding domain
MRKTPSPWSVHQGRDPEAELRRLKGCFQKVSSRYFRRVKLRRSYRFTILVVLAAVASFAVTMGVMPLQPWSALSSSPWTAAMQAKHIAAYPSCTAARAVGLAPAYRGQPGYWPQHDRDKDGIACEPYPRR